MPSVSQTDTPNNAGPRRSSKGYPPQALQEIAVLFTDIVGSSKYFQSHGDIAGRRMLRRHQDLATPAVIEHGGIVVKMLGDSVMAYFLDAGEALKAGIKIQQLFRGHNSNAGPSDRIYIRLGIHFGEGIVEENDIFGDVVNMAAKFLHLVKADQIVVSNPVSARAGELASIHYRPFAIPPNSVLPRDFRLFEVLWDEGVHFDPLLKTLVYLRPLFHLGNNDFQQTWNTMAGLKGGLWGGGVETAAFFPDKSVGLVLQDAALSLALAKRIMEFLKTHPGGATAPFIPAQIIIDSGSYLRAGKLVLDDLAVPWEKLDPGEIYISTRARDHIQKTANITIQQAPDRGLPEGFLKIAKGVDRKEESRLFLYQNALIQGEHAPCFYCGDRRHPTRDCPTKGMTELTHGLGNLGYLPLDEINVLFLNYLNGTRINPGALRKAPSTGSNPSLWAYQGFYELKAVYQLRFFRTLWNVREEDWNRIRDLPPQRDERDMSGQVWIGQDCIRVSRLKQAKNILLDCLRRDPQDYKVYCALAFLYIEREDFAQAVYYLKKAQDCPLSTPQEIFILFLLSRLYDLGNNRARAEEMIRKILRLSPFCYDAIYQDILFQFRKGQEAMATHQLIKLIKKNREFYLHALIDPALAPFSALIHIKLKAHIEEVKTQAGEATEKAKEALAHMTRWLDPADHEVGEAKSRWQKIEELSNKQSYFAYLDIVHFAEALISMGRRSIEARRTELSVILKQLRRRSESQMALVKGFQYEFLVHALREDLLGIQAKIEALGNKNETGVPNTFKEVFESVKGLSGRLDTIGARLKRLDTIRGILLFLSGFFKKSLLYQSANLVVALILFPLLAYYLNFLFPVFSITSQNIWSYQKAVLIFGGAAGLILSILSASKGTKTT